MAVRRTTARCVSVRGAHRALAALCVVCGAAVAAHARPASAAAPQSAPAASAAPVVAAASASGVATNFKLDPTHTFVHWQVLHMDTSTIRGRFARSSGTVQFDPKVHSIYVGIVIDTASVSSGVPVPDVTLRGSELLDAAAYPQAYFVASSARFEGEVPRDVRGELTLRGVSQPLTLHALRWNCAFSPLFRREVCGGDFEATFDRSTFGITYGLPFVADRVRLVVQVEAIRQ